MQRFVAVITIFVVIIAASTAFFLQHKQQSSTDEQYITVHLMSDPYPAVVGDAHLVVKLKDADGNPVDDATVSLAAQMDHEGSLRHERTATLDENGEYRAQITWSMAGKWLVDVSVDLPDSETTLKDQFLVVIYAVPIEVAGVPESFQSLTNSGEPSDTSDREYRIIIPVGTDALVLAGLGEELIPPDIKLELEKQNILVIENNDIVNHQVGPFFIRAGETIRQEFLRPAVYEGTCSFRPGTAVDIIVQ